MLLLLVLTGCGGGEKEEGAPVFPRAPVVLISIDTLRADRLPAYGYGGVETPALDRLRRDAVLFENAYSPCPLTLPSHTSLLTGLRPPEHGVRNNVGYRLAPEVETLPALLRRRGYATGAAVSAYVLRRETGLAAGFDAYDDAVAAWAGEAMGAVQRPGGESAAAARSWIEAHLEARGEEPFFFFLHLFEPHSPYEPPEPFRSRFADPYDGEIATADAVVGEFLDFLRRAGVYERAVVLLLSDHGEGLGDHGEREHGILLYREALRVPLLLKLPGGARAGTSVAGPVGLVDVPPTVAALLGLEMPPGLAGRPLLAPEAGTEVAAPRRLYSETYYPRIHLGWSELRSLVGPRWHLIEGPRPELFDVVADPEERRDLLSRERRTYRELEGGLATIEPRFEGPAAAGAEEMARLAALGYLSAPASAGDGPRPDPRDMLPVLDDMEAAFGLAAAGRLAEAVAALEALLAANPDLQDARLQLAGVQRALGRYEEAEATLKRAVERFPALLPAVALQMAEVYLDAGRYDEAAEQARAGAASSAGKADLLLGRAQLGRGEAAAAEETARRLAREHPAFAVPALLLRARARLQAERPAEALELLEEARRDLGSGPPAQGLEFLRGDALARLGRLAEAEAALRREIEDFPGTTQAWASLAFVYGAERRFAEIEPLLERMARANPTPAAYALAADTLARLGNTEAAARWRARGHELAAAEGS